MSPKKANGSKGLSVLYNALTRFIVAELRKKINRSDTSLIFFHINIAPSTQELFSIYSFS